MFRYQKKDGGLSDSKFKRAELVLESSPFLYIKTIRCYSFRAED